DMDHGDAGGGVQIDRTRGQHDSGAWGLPRGGDGKNRLAPGGGGGVADGDRRLTGGARGGPAAFSRSRPRVAPAREGGPGRRGAQQVLGGRGDFRRLRHAADAGFAGFRHLAGVRADRVHAVAAQLHHVATGGGIVPHQRVHRRRQQDRLVGGKKNGAGEIV